MVFVYPRKLKGKNLIGYKIKQVSNIFFCCCLVTKLCLIPFRPHGLQPPRLLCPWDFPGKNTGVGCHFFFLQGSSLSHQGSPVFSFGLTFFSIPEIHLNIENVCQIQVNLRIQLAEILLILQTVAVWFRIYLFAMVFVIPLQRSHRD